MNALVLFALIGTVAPAAATACDSRFYVHRVLGDQANTNAAAAGRDDRRRWDFTEIITGRLRLHPCRTYNRTAARWWLLDYEYDASLWHHVHSNDTELRHPLVGALASDTALAVALMDPALRTSPVQLVLPSPVVEYFLRRHLKKIEDKDVRLFFEHAVIFITPERMFKPTPGHKNKNNSPYAVDTSFDSVMSPYPPPLRLDSVSRCVCAVQ